MDEELNNWLLEYEPIRDIAEVIHNEELEDGIDTLALQRTGVENLDVQYVGEKGYYRQYQYSLLLKSASEDDIQRINNLDWLDQLQDWLDKQNRERNFPVLTNKEVKKITCSNAITFETSEDGSESTYYLQIYFDIKGGNNNG